MARRAVFVGIDVGTSGVRVVCVDASGNVLLKVSRTLEPRRLARGGIHEQKPEGWWRAVCQCTQQIVEKLTRVEPRATVKGVAVTSTSGTLLCTDSAGKPLRPAILYDDTRAASVVELLNSRKGTIRWNASHSLAKALWVRKKEPAVWEQTKRLLHPTDWLTGRLCDGYGFADFTNALKLGYECESNRWSEVISAARIPQEFLPAIVKPGSIVGKLTAKSAEATGLPRETSVVAGATDGMAGLIASGAHAPSHANTTLGTTIVWKVIAGRRPPANQGIYTHQHPAGYWVPGAAGNTGPGSIAVAEAGRSKKELDRAAASFLPSELICYPLAGTGERFPFLNPNATAFVAGRPGNHIEWHAAQLQALGFVERWGYEILGKIGVEVGETLFSTGEAARSRVLSQTRADILNRTVARCKEPSAAFGAAILAAAGTYIGDVRESIRLMTKVEESLAPQPAKTERYDTIYGRFREACQDRGYAA